MIGSLVSWLGGESKTVAFAILGAVVGFIAKGIFELWSARRKDKLDRVNQQLKSLYGPLYALNHAGGSAWIGFRSTTRPKGGFFGTLPPPNEEELAAWKRWMLTVFHPLNEEMLSIITKNSDLLIESYFPESLQLFCAHVTAYRVVLDRWSKNDFAEYTSVLNFPSGEMNAYLENSFEKLKSEQARLLGAKRQARPTSTPPRGARGLARYLRPGPDPTRRAR
jgi:hypothetical protein